jgi:CspA family cold shock protein
MTVMTTNGRVREWHRGEGWGVIDTPETPGGCWAHFSHLLTAGYKSLDVGDRVELVWEVAEQDGYSFRAVAVWPLGETPVRTVAEPGPSDAYRSSLRVTFRGPAPPPSRPPGRTSG